MTEATQSNFERLAAINVNEQVEKKGGLSYLSWAWAVDRLLRADPDADWNYSDTLYLTDRTALVFCTVKAFGKSRTMQLPVMDYKNRAIQEPDAFSINTAMQRCLVKAIALHGLGLYIYAGEDLPPGEEKPEGETEKRPNTATQVAKDSFATLTEEHQKTVQAMATMLIDLCDNREPMVPYVTAHVTEDDHETRLALWSLLPSNVRSAFKREQEAVRKQQNGKKFTPAELGGQA